MLNVKLVSDTSYIYIHNCASVASWLVDDLYHNINDHPICLSYIHTNLDRIVSMDQQSLAESLTQLLAPIMDLLAGARSRPYLPHSSVVSSLELLTSLLRQWLPQEDVVKEREIKPCETEVISGMSICNYVVFC